MSTTALQQQPIPTSSTNDQIAGNSGDQPALKPPTPSGTQLKAKSKPGSLASALNLQKSSGKIATSRANLNNADMMKLRNSGSTRVLADQQDLKTLEPVRRIITEDLRWNTGMPRPLVEFCLSSITKNVTARPFLRRLSERYRNVVMDGLNLNLPLEFIADNISDKDLAGKKFWKRYCEHYYLPAQCDPRQHDGSWKQTFFELYVETILEAVVPGPELSLSALAAKLKVAVPFVRRLHIKQLRPESWHGARGEERVVDIGHLPFKSTFTFHLDLLPPPKETLEKLQKKVSAMELYDQAAKEGVRKHLNLGEVLAPFNNLIELEVNFTLLEVGMGYRWSLFGMASQDVNPLRHVVINNPGLELLVLRGNLINDSICPTLTEALMSATSLKKLVLAHNRIGDKGAAALAELLVVQKTEEKPNAPAIKHLDLSNNTIGPAGALAIANALCTNTTLEALKLDMNESVGDEGLAKFIRVYSADNYTMKHLNISGCNAANETAAALSDAIRHYGDLNARIIHEKELIKQGLMLSNAEISIKVENENAAESEDGQSEDDRKDTKNRRKGAKPALSNKKPNTAKTVASRKSASTKDKAKPTPPTTAGSKKSAAGKKAGKSNSPSGSNTQLNRATTAASEASDNQNNDTKLEDQPNNPVPITQKTEPMWSNLPFPVGFTHISAQSNWFNDQPNGIKLQDSLKQNPYILLFDLRGTNLSDERIRAINFELASRRVIEESTDWNISVEQI